LVTHIVIEELTLQPIGDSRDAPTAYRLIVDGKSSPLYFSRRQVEDAAAAALARADSSN